MARRLWLGRLQRYGDAAEELCLRAGGGEGEADAAVARAWDLANGEHQPVGGGVDHRANLIGDR